MIQAFKHPFAGTINRPNSRPTSPTPFEGERPSRPTTRLSLTSFRKASPAPSAIPQPTVAPLVQDGTYLNALSLKLSEAVAKALAAPSGPGAAGEPIVAGRRLLPQGRGSALGALITSELNASTNNYHLHRSVLRSLHRPLSVLMTNLTAHLLPLLNSSAFSAPIGSATHTLNPTQAHSLAYATFVGEVLESFHVHGLGTTFDGLRPVRDGLENLTARVVLPLIAAIRNDITTLVTALESPANGSPKLMASASSKAVTHPSVIALQNMMPVYTRALQKYTAPFPHVAEIQKALTSLLIGVTWKAMVALSNRIPRPGTPPITPKALTPAGSPPASPIPKKRQLAAFSISIPGSRPPSPNRPVSPSAIHAAAGDDAKTVFGLFQTLPHPSSSEADEAIKEAMNGLSALSVLMVACWSLPSAAELEKLTADIPTLICLPIVFKAYLPHQQLSLATIMNATEEEYREMCLPSFSRAENCAYYVGSQALRALGEDGSSEDDKKKILVEWLEDEVSDSD